jgi:ribokinase
VTAQEVADKVQEFGGEEPIVLAQLELPLPAVEQAATSAQAMNGRFILNLAPAEIISKELLAKCDPIIVNESEAELLTGKKISSIQDAKQLAAQLAQQAKSAVITLGADGAVFASRGAELATHLPSEKVAVVDTTGAGDAFVGALAAAFSRGETLDAAVQAGLKAGAKAVQHFGAQPPKG